MVGCARPAVAAHSHVLLEHARLAVTTGIVMAGEEADEVDSSLATLRRHVVHACIAAGVDPRRNLPGLPEGERRRGVGLRLWLGCLKGGRSNPLCSSWRRAACRRTPVAGDPFTCGEPKQQTGCPARTHADIIPRDSHGISLPLGTIPTTVSAAGRADGDQRPASTGQRGGGE